MSRFLVDSHPLIWWATDPSILSDEARITLAGGRNQVFASHASAWELAIKESRGKLVLPAPSESLLANARFHPLPITLAHIAEVKALPFLHKDPFDRLLVAQARVEKLTLITRDAHLALYDVPVLAA